MLEGAIVFEGLNSGIAITALITEVFQFCTSSVDPNYLLHLIRINTICLMGKNYEGKSISNQSIPFPIDRDTQDFHALFQYMF